VSLSPKLIGFGKFVAKLEIQRVVRRALLQRHYESQGADLVEKMKEAVDVDSGALRDSIRCVPAPKKPGVLIIAGGTPATTRVSKGRTYDEALLLEYGTRREAARPFFFPTIEAEKRGLIDGITGAMKSDRNDG
jgi:hypothetical protein